MISYPWLFVLYMIIYMYVLWILAVMYRRHEFVYFSNTNALISIDSSYLPNLQKKLYKHCTNSWGYGSIMLYIYTIHIYAYNTYFIAMLVIISNLMYISGFLLFRPRTMVYRKQELKRMRKILARLVEL